MPQYIVEVYRQGKITAKVNLASNAPRVDATRVLRVMSASEVRVYHYDTLSLSCTIKKGK